jgi:hypothetical protein
MTDDWTDEDRKAAREMAGRKVLEIMDELGL